MTRAGAAIRSHREALLLAFFAAFAIAPLALFANDADVRTLSLIFASIVLEALPFMLLGALAGGLIEAFVPRERLMSLLPKRDLPTILIAAGMGILFPVCECAVVPVVKRLTRKGLPPFAAIAYLLGAPIVNPIVAMSTSLAYRPYSGVAFLRCAMGYCIAVTVALFMWSLFRDGGIFLPYRHEAGKGLECTCPHCSCETAADGASLSLRLLASFRHGSDDFLATGHYLVIGAFIAALSQTYIDRNFFSGLAEYPFLAPAGMIVLAVLLNLCSESDAFVAASFRNLTPFSAQMAFMLIGPMFDLKLLLMYRELFTGRAIVSLALLILVSVSCAALLLGG